MKRTARTPRRRLAIAGLALALPLLAGCGFDVQTNQVYQPAVGANNRSQVVDVLGAVIVSPKKGSGAFLATLVDNSDTQGDQLTGITAASGVTVGTLPEVTLKPQVPVNLADLGGGIAVKGDAVDTTTSNYVELTLEFANSDPVRINVPVVVADGPYADYGSPSASPSAPNSVAASGSTGAGG